MLNRRTFLWEAPAAAAFARSAWGQTPAAPTKIAHVDIVHNTHTDVGYTALPSVIRDLQRRYLDAAVDACRADRSFHWTVESLLGLDDWWQVAPLARRNALVDLVHAGQMDVMAMPFNQTPFLNGLQWRQMMSWISPALWRTLNIRLAMQNDVNGVPRAGGVALLDHGIRHLMTGSNDDSGGPPFPRPTSFWWRMPDGRRMFVWLGEHYGSLLRYVPAAIQGNRFRLDDDSIRKAHEGLLTRLAAIEAMGYPHQRLILSFTHPVHYDNGGPFPTLAPFIAGWNRLGLKPALRFTTATQAVLDMEKAIGTAIPTREGEWTDWWANGDASAPREVAASRQAKRFVSAAMSPVFGAMPQRAQPDITRILKDLCLFDEHTWGANTSVSAPYAVESLGQWVEKSDLAFRPYGMSQALLNRRIRAKIDPLPAGVYAVNPSECELTGWVPLIGVSQQTRSLEDLDTHQTAAINRDGAAPRVWVEKFARESVRGFKTSTTAAPAETQPAEKPAVQLDASAWPVSISWNGMQKPLFDGAMGDFLRVGVVPPADRKTLTQLHANPDAGKREAIRKTALRETSATYGKAGFKETPHTLIYTQEVHHERVVQARRVLEVWRREPRIRLSVRFDRLSAVTPPEVFFLSFTLPEGTPLPQFSSGDLPFTPYRDQLGATCKDYYAIDGWAHYATSAGHWLWVTRDAPLVAVGGPHVVELIQTEPAHPNRILAVVFDNFWHTNFVADSHGTMEFQFDLLWRENLEKPADLAAAVSLDPLTIVNPAIHETDVELKDIYRP